MVLRCQLIFSHFFQFDWNTAEFSVCSSFQYDLIIRRLTRVAKHPNADEFQDMLSKYQFSVSKGGKKLDIPEVRGTVFFTLEASKQ